MQEELDKKIARELSRLGKLGLTEKQLMAVNTSLNEIAELIIACFS